MSVALSVASTSPAPARVVCEATSPDGLQCRLRGHVRSYCPFKGIGFVKCDGVQSGCTRDVFVDRAEAEKSGLTTGAMISFTLTYDSQGRPRAEGIRVLIQGSVMKERVSKLLGTDIDWHSTYTGIIRTLWQGGKDSIFSVPSMQRKDAGGAFIMSEEAHTVFGLDIWAYPSKLAGFKVGDVVKFKVEIDSRWSYPCAYEVREADPALQNTLGAKFSVKSSVSSTESAPVTATAKESIACVPTPCRSATHRTADDCAPDELATTELSKTVWQKFKVLHGTGHWWWCEKDHDWFLEDEPGPWTKYADPDSDEHYWWKDEDSWFWA